MEAYGTYSSAELFSVVIVSNPERVLENLPCSHSYSGAFFRELLASRADRVDSVPAGMAISAALPDRGHRGTRSSGADLGGGDVSGQAAERAVSDLDFHQLQIRADDQRGVGGVLNISGSQTRRDLFQYECRSADFDVGHLGDNRIHNLHTGQRKLAFAENLGH